MFTDGCSNRILVDLFFYRVSSSCYRVCFSGEPYRCLQPTFGGRSRSQQMKGREMESHVKRVGTSVSSFSRLKKQRTSNNWVKPISNRPRLIDDGPTPALLGNSVKRHGTSMMAANALCRPVTDRSQQKQKTSLEPFKTRIKWWR